MDPVDAAVDAFFMRFMLLQSYDGSDDQIKHLFQNVIELPCEEHGPGCFSNTIFVRLDEGTKTSFKEKINQLSKGFKIADLVEKSTMIENISNDMKTLICYVPGSKCITHVAAEKIISRSRSMMMGTTPGLNLFSMFSGVSGVSGLSSQPDKPYQPNQSPSNNHNIIKAPSLITRARSKPVYDE